MLRISRLTDYGTLVLAHLSSTDTTPTSAADVAAAIGIASPTVSKLLKLLAKADLVTSTRGAQGGYRLARTAADISAADIIDALEGPVHITECSATDSNCDFEATCNVGGAWQRMRDPEDYSNQTHPLSVDPIAQQVAQITLPDLRSDD